jgi:serine/threonine protein kinase
MQAYERLKLLGEGSFGKAHLMREKGTKNLVCVKSINVSKMGRKEKESCKLEVSLMKRLNHPNIVAFKDSFLSKSHSCLYIVMQYCDGGDLEMYINRKVKKGMHNYIYINIYIYIYI